MRPVTTRWHPGSAAPGRPERPLLVSPRHLPHRGLGTPEGRLALLHAVAHIEFNAINLAWDAVYRFRGMPFDYYRDWIGVAEGAGESGDYGWLQIFGACGIRSEQDALANKKLGPTSDAGQVDDAAATGIFINGMHLGTATGGADAVNSSGFLNFPTLEVQMEPET